MSDFTKRLLEIPEMDDVVSSPDNVKMVAPRWLSEVGVNVSSRGEFTTRDGRGRIRSQTFYLVFRKRGSDDEPLFYVASEAFPAGGSLDIEAPKKAYHGLVFRLDAIMGYHPVSE